MVDSIKVALIFIILAAFCSCVNNKECAVQYIGTYKLHLPFLNDSQQVRFVKSRGWDTVRLVSRPNGTYFFNSDDPLLKRSEGKWFVESRNIEGDCIGYIKQNNLRKAIPKGPFIILIDSVRFSVQFIQIGDAAVENL